MKSETFAIVCFGAAVLVALLGIYQHGTRPLLRRIVTAIGGGLALTLAVILVQRYRAIPNDRVLLSAIFCASAIILYLLDQIRTTSTGPPLPPSEEQSVQGADQIVDSEKLNNRIKELERELEEENKKYKHELNQKEVLREHRDSIESELRAHKWLHKMAEIQAEEIDKYVAVERVYLCYQELTASIPRILFDVEFNNKSVFDISIEDTMEEHIEIAGQPLLRDKRVIYNEKDIPPSSKGRLIIEQRLSPEEAALVAKCEKEVLGAFFYFHKLVLMVRGGTKVSRVKSKPLILPEHICTKDEIHADNWEHYEAKISALKAEIAALKSQLGEDNAKLASPDIQGEIKEVYFSKHTNLDASMVVSNHFYNDFYFTLRAYVANHGAATTIAEFQFFLISNGVRTKGEKALLKGYYIERYEDSANLFAVDDRVIEEALTNIESFNDDPLDHTRNGWLRFRVREIREAENEAEIEIELSAIDKLGTPHKLISLPQAQWQDDERIKRRDA